jgi:CheY-like chemotaxis protein
VLTAEGLAVDEAAGGPEALDQLRRQPPDLVLLDLLMPGMDGFHVVEAIRQKEAWRHIPIWIVTAKDLAPEDRQRLHGRIQAVVSKDQVGRDGLRARLRRLGLLAESGA